MFDDFCKLLACSFRMLRIFFDRLTRSQNTAQSNAEGSLNITGHGTALSSPTSNRHTTAPTQESMQHARQIPLCAFTANPQPLCHLSRRRTATASTFLEPPYPPTAPARSKSPRSSPQLPSSGTTVTLTRLVQCLSTTPEAPT